MSAEGLAEGLAAGLAEGVSDGLALDALAQGLPVRIIARGHSMRPALRDGDRLILDANTTTVAVGDVVVVPDRPFAVCHRIIARVGERVWVKGDAMGMPDGAYRRAELTAQVVGATRAGLPISVRPAGSLTRSVLFALPRIGRNLWVR